MGILSTLFKPSSATKNKCEGCQACNEMLIGLTATPLGREALRLRYGSVNNLPQINPLTAKGCSKSPDGRCVSIFEAAKTPTILFINGKIMEAYEVAGVTDPDFQEQGHGKKSSKRNYAKIIAKKR